MVVSAQSQSATYSAFQSISQINFQTGQLCIIGDGAVSLAAGCILSGGTQELRIWVPKSRSVVNRQLPTEFEVRERGAHSVGMLSLIHI